MSLRLCVAAGMAMVCLGMLTSCGVDEPTEYSDENREAFLAACIDADVDGLFQQRVCQCAYDEAEATLPFERFLEIDRELAGAAEPVLPDDLLDLLAGCIVEEGDL